MNSASRATILVVDDEPINLRVLVESLRDEHRVLMATDGAGALEQLRRHQHIDLMLLDVEMPEMNGLEVLQRLRVIPDFAQIPVIFVTGRTREGDEEEGLALGAVDYITKPVSVAIVRARVNTHLALNRARAKLAQRNQILAQKIGERTREITQIQEVIIYCLTSLSETRDQETGNHILRTQHYVRALAEQLQTHTRFAHQLDAESIGLMFRTAPLHDIGKVGIPDHILQKPGKLTELEFDIMKTHAELGHRALVQAEYRLGAGGVPFLGCACDIAYSHHEKWDGSGYPQGLAGGDIPLSARLMALADVYDALISKRCYKPAFPHQQAESIIIEGRGSHFDPDLVDAFVAIRDQFIEIATQFSDAE